MYLIPRLTYKIQRKRPNNLFMNLDIFLQKVAFTSISSSESILVGLVNMNAAEDCHLSRHECGRRLSLLRCRYYSFAL